MDLDIDLIDRPLIGPPPERVRPGGAVRLTARALATGLMVLSFAAMGLAVAAVIAGYRVSVIRSGSMYPTLHIGALEISRPVQPLSLHPGDLVTFEDPALKGATVTHRVVSRTQEGGIVKFVTKGDANRSTERWQVPLGSKLGLGVFHINGVGRWLAFTATPWARTVAIAVLAGALLRLSLGRIWRTR